MDRRLDLALVCLLLVAIGPIVPWLTAHESSRYAFTAALTEQSRFEVDDYEPLLSTDLVRLNGHVYSDKAPGQPILAVPVLAIAEELGADPATDFRREGNLGAWSLSLVFSVVPGAALLVLMRRNAARTESARLAATAAIALAFGTLLLPMSSALYAHVFVGALGFGAWHLLSRPGVMTAPALVGAAVLSAVAVTSEYPMAGVAAVLAWYVLAHHGWRRAAVFIAPHLLAVGLVVAHSLRVYDRIGTGYSAKDIGIRDSFGIPNPAHMLRIFFAEKGFMFTPIVIVGAIGLVQAVRHRRSDIAVPALVVTGFFLLQSGWVNPWGGETAGPRYMIPSMPFLVVPVASMLPALTPRIRTALISLGMVSMGLVVVTLPLVLTGETLIVGHLRNIDRFGLNPTLFTMAFGPLGWVLHLGLVGVAVAAVRRYWPTDGADRSAPDADLAAAG
ncbi:hypothetical protein [Actinospongicola halichondriae]|uniref:hypothetical protein n=1 Tax=Actinospongicola halichondriae TaxID=3236844 RepID=UPI003D4E3AA5